MKNLLILSFLSIFTFVNCNKSDIDEINSDSLGYYKGMPRSEYEYVTGQYLESGFFRSHWSGLNDKYSLEDYSYGEKIFVEDMPYVNEEDRYIQKWFYPSFTFKLYGDKLVSINIEFNHGNTIWSNESPGLQKTEIDAVMSGIKEYFKLYKINANFEVIPYEDSYDENDYFEIIGTVVLK